MELSLQQGTFLFSSRVGGHAVTVAFNPVVNRFNDDTHPWW
jgi:hypothetical protein